MTVEHVKKNSQLVLGSLCCFICLCLWHRGSFALWMKPECLRWRTVKTQKERGRRVLSNVLQTQSADWELKYFGDVWSKTEKKKKMLGIQLKLQQNTEYHCRLTIWPIRIPFKTLDIYHLKNFCQLWFSEFEWRPLET